MTFDLSPYARRRRMPHVGTVIADGRDAERLEARLAELRRTVERDEAETIALTQSELDGSVSQHQRSLGR